MRVLNEDEFCRINYVINCTELNKETHNIQNMFYVTLQTLYNVKVVHPVRHPPQHFPCGKLCSKYGKLPYYIK